MNRKKIVAGNWKMNTTLLDAIALANEVRIKSKNNLNVEKIIFPPFPFLKSTIDALRAETNFFVGAQNCSDYDRGAYTGEVSAEMLNSIGCHFALVGHSERRHYFKETDQQLILKIKQALKNNIKVVFCFGEQLEERKNEKQFETVKQQLNTVLNEFTELDFNSFYLAYEPVWAIGTGETATPYQAQEMHAFIRTVITELFSKTTADNIPILYGGSCNANNAQELFSCPDVDGGLIGGASLKADDFCKIIASFA